MQPLIVIPARMASVRLPGKPLAGIGGAAMIVQVWRRAMEAQLGPVLVACDGEAIAEAVAKEGGVAVLTDPALPSGSDRVWAAVMAQDAAGRHDIIINVQGDLPTLDPALLQKLMVPFATRGGAGVADLSSPHPGLLPAGEGVDIVTLACAITREEEKDAQSVVKMVPGAAREGWVEAADFVRGRAAAEPMYHHIGVYAYRRAALERFVGLPPSARERERKLEQMRALDAGMRIACVLVDTVPLGVDTPEDLERAREMLVAARR